MRTAFSFASAAAAFASPSSFAVEPGPAARVPVDDDAVGRVEGLATVLARELAVSVGDGRLGLSRDGLACKRRWGEQALGLAFELG